MTHWAVAQRFEQPIVKLNDFGIGAFRDPASEVNRRSEARAFQLAFVKQSKPGKREYQHRRRPMFIQGKQRRDSPFIMIFQEVRGPPDEGVSLRTQMTLKFNRQPFDDEIDSTERRPGLYP